MLNKQAGGATISRHTYTLDAVGNRTRADEAIPSASVTDYAYDRLYRLTSVTAPSGTTTYTYDPVGNRESQTRGTTTNSSYDRADRITTAGGVAYTVDANGNLTARGSDTFGYDQANRLKSATVGGTTATYAWDGDGKRASATAGGSTTGYLYDVNAELPVVLDDGARTYVWGLGLAYGIDGSGGLEAYHADGLGSTRALSDASQAITTRYETDEFGVPTTTTGSSTQPFRYTGEQRDSETGFVYLRSRLYDPAVGRFLQRDGWPGELGRPTSLHRYAYVEQNPATLTDPSGEHPLLMACLAGAGFSVTVEVAFKLYSGEKLTGNQVLRNAVEGCVGGMLGFGFAQTAAKLTKAAPVVGRVGGEALECAINSFSAETPVATPDGAADRGDRGWRPGAGLGRGERRAGLLPGQRADPPPRRIGAAADDRRRAADDHRRAPVLRRRPWLGPGGRAACK